MNEQDREGWNGYVSDLLTNECRIPIGAAFKQPRADTRAALEFLAALLRKDLLPQSGRLFLAGYLEHVSRGGDPRSQLLPRPTKKKKSYSNLGLFVEVEREILRREDPNDRSDMQLIYESVGRRHDIRAETVAKDTSKGRRVLKDAIRRNVEAGAAREKVIAGIAELTQLPCKAILEAIRRD